MHSLGRFNMYACIHLFYFFCHHYKGKKKEKLNTTIKFVTITINVVVIGVIATTKKSMQAIIINSEANDLCNTRFSL